MILGIRDLFYFHRVFLCMVPHIHDVMVISGFTFQPLCLIASINNNEGIKGRVVCGCCSVLLLHIACLVVALQGIDIRRRHYRVLSFVILVLTLVSVKKPSGFVVL